MTKQFILEKGLTAGGNRFNKSGTTTLDLTEDVRQVQQNVTKEIKPIQMPKTQSNWRVAKPETRIYDFKRITNKLSVRGFLIGSSATSKKNDIIAMVEQGGSLIVKWNDETDQTTDLLGDKWWIQNATFTDRTEDDEANLEDGDVKYEFNMELTRGVERG